jgi:hypothetical protein
MAALGRRFGSIDELVGWYDRIAMCEPAQIKRVNPADISFYVAPDMPAMIDDVAICEKGFGDILGFIVPGHERDFQAAYQRDLHRDPVLWHQQSHRLMMGNGFFLVNITNPGDSLGPSTYGVLFLRCDAEARISFDREEFPADIAGCLFLRQEYGYDTF